MFHNLRTSRSAVLTDAAEVALYGLGPDFSEFQIDVEGADTSSPVVRVRLRLPWWRRVLFEPVHVERRIARVLSALAFDYPYRVPAQSYRVEVRAVAEL